MTKKGWVTLLLAVSSLAAAMLHVQIDPDRESTLHSPSQIDSLITQTTYDFRVPADQIRVQTVRHDSIFTRKIYTIQVPPGFSKTTFHHHLRARLAPLDVSVFGTVEFPERDLKLNILYNHTIHRTINVEADSDIAQQPGPIPRFPG